MSDKGMLKIQVFKENSYIPVEGSKVSVIQEKEDSGRQIIQNLTTDSSGLTNEIELEAPPLNNSMNPSDKSPYSLCNIIVDAPGYKRLRINGCQIYPNVTSTQPCNLELINIRQSSETVLNISPNKLVGNYAPKILEDLDQGILPKPVPPSPAPSLIAVPMLLGVVVPELVIIHDGLPDDSDAPNYTKTFKDYIKNVVSSEIYPTWSENTIRANVYAIVSFTLNRVFTEWYKGKGKKFIITSSTAYDQNFIYARNIFDNISRIVDEIFTAYIKRPNKGYPLLAQYCDGIRVQCPGITLDTAKIVEGIPTSYPGYTLTIGSKDSNVKIIQELLNEISEKYPAIPKLIVDEIYGQDTKKAVTTFQEIFNLLLTGDVDYATWYEISNIYVGITKMAELRSSNYRLIERKFIPPVLNNYNIPTVTYFEEEE